MYSEGSLLQSVAIVASRLEAVRATLLAKGIISEEELGRHYAKTEQEQKELAAIYFPDLLDALSDNEGKPTS